jgi:hypothetical protein
LGLLAVGLGTGAAVASAPGVASADSSTDWLSSIDQLLGGLSVAAQTTPLEPMQVSISGIDLFPITADTPFAFSGPGDIAIAIGDDAIAQAFIPGGIFNVAIADGDYSYADGGEGGGSFDVAIADGAGSVAAAGGMEGSLDPSGSFDLAAVFGDMLHAFAIGNFVTDMVPAL